MASNSVNTGVTRRGFVGGAAAGLVGTTLAAGIARADETTATAQAEDGVDAVTQRLLDRGIAGANLPDARPIAPAEPPAAWDEEADVVVVGLGGGGLVACAYLAQQGLSVIGVEKDGITGGAGRHAAVFANCYGGSADQNAMEFALPTYPPDLNAFVRMYEADNSFSIDEWYLRNLLALSGEACDFIMQTEGMNMVCGGPVWRDADVASGKQNHVLGMENPTNAMEAAARAAGADLRLLTQCTQLVFDGQRVCGIVVSDSENEVRYLGASQGVILCAGGFGMNRDLIKAYLPSAYEGTVLGGPMPTHTGEAFRMGLGLGGDFCGYDSWCNWEGAIDEMTAGGDGSFFHYFWHGERQLFHNPWLIIDKNGRRQPYNAPTQELYPNPGGQMGDLTNTGAWMAAVGHRVYSICDSTFPTTVFENEVLTETTTDTCRIPISDPATLIENGGLVSADWLAEVDEAVERGAVKKADTIEGLAEQLGLDPTVLQGAVDNWNRICEQGEDDEMSIPYHPSWLHPVAEPPYYGAIIGGQMGKTMCGLRTDPHLNVMREDGSTIPGLYANCTTAGGLSGESNYGCYWNSTVFGGVGTSWITGYIAAKELMGTVKGA